MKNIRTLKQNQKQNTTKLHQCATPNLKANSKIQLPNESTNIYKYISIITLLQLFYQKTKYNQITKISKITVLKLQNQI